MNASVNTKTHTLKVWLAALLILAVCIVPMTILAGRSNALPWGTASAQYPSGGQAGGTVVDISAYSTGVNFDVMLEHGLSGVMLRAANGLQKDTSFDSYYDQAKARNIPVGAYHYVYWNRQPDLASATQKAQEEVSFLIQCLQWKKIDGYVALDLEGQSSLSPEDMTTVANAYIQALRNAGYKPILYCNMDWVLNRLDVSRINAPLWLAYYYDSGSDEFPVNSYGDTLRSLQDRLVMWQYSQRGNYQYWGATTDLNHLYYSFTG